MKPLPTHSFILFFLPKSGSTALMYAAAFGYLSCARVLLQGGASTSVKNQAGKTALDFAREYMRTNVVTLLEGEVSGTFIRDCVRALLCLFCACCRAQSTA
eukprot:m.301077 g.301077  ORF g.301077 m.301077 type:complete len:101 (-) comp55219_c0_seq4:1094-1396(-)